MVHASESDVETSDPTSDDISFELSLPEEAALPDDEEDEDEDDDDEDDEDPEYDPDDD